MTATEDSAKLIADVLRLDEKATAGPWDIARFGSGPRWRVYDAQNLDAPEFINLESRDNAEATAFYRTAAPPPP